MTLSLVSLCIVSVLMYSYSHSQTKFSCMSYNLVQKQGLDTFTWKTDIIMAVSKSVGINSKLISC